MTADPTDRLGIIPDLEPGSLEWSKLVCLAANYFFNADPFRPERAEIARLIDKPVQPGQFEPWTATDFTKFLRAKGFRPTDATLLSRLLAKMERVGLLLGCGWDSSSSVMGQYYISVGGAHYLSKGDLWLSEVLGFEVVIESYNSVTVRISRSGRPGSGTGLVLDHSHLVTNRHVIEGLTGREVDIIHTDLSFKRIGADLITHQCCVHGHQKLDVAVIEAKIDDTQGFPRLPDMQFREPNWVDEIYVFGYPYVPGTIDEPITVQPGGVVNPTTIAAAAGGYPQHKAFLFSAIARPGNSGGPIVAQDGRVIGLVEEHGQEGLSGTGVDSTQSEDAPLFYRGIPASEVVRAIDELGFTGLAWLDRRA
jgi:hypothetical protein